MQGRVDLTLIGVPIAASSCPAEENTQISGGWFSTLREVSEAQKEVKLSARIS